MAMDFGTSVGAAIMKDLVYAAIRQARYSFCFSSVVEDLGKEKHKLILTREGVLDQAEKAKEKTKRIGNDVEQWLNDADILIAEVEKLEEKAETNKSCFLGHCPNWIWQYRLGKQATKKTQAIIKHIRKSDFKQFARLATLIGMKYYPSEGFIYFESTQSTYDHILNALKDDEVYMIGLYGMGGTGKTALVKQVGKEAEQLFDKVIFVAVSSTVEVRKVQGKIASSLGFELKEEDESERARRLCMRLTSGERILIILDDVWEMLDFEAIGIPFGENHMGCNVLLTTRSLQLCTLMDCHRIIPLSLIADEEAWTLFQKHACITDNTSNALKDLAQEITRECKGLPVAIKAVASTLKSKTLVEWEEALETLRNSRPMDIETGLENPYKCLQLSYDNLKNEEAKSLFLLCSIFPEDSEIPLESLIRYGFGLGLFEEVNSYKRARNKIGATINKLINSGLLLQSEERHSVIMHDLVRDVALWIAKKEIQVIMGPQMDIKAVAEDTSIKDTIRSLYCHNINEFPNQLAFPNLKILYVYRDGRGSFELPDALFKGMNELKVLTVHYHRLASEAPSLMSAQSIQFLANLRTLCLRGCRLDHISFLGSLERLETLEFCNCKISELPNGTVGLKKLRLLDVSLCIIGENPYEVLGRCSQLEELYFLKNDLSERVSNDQNLDKFFQKSGTSHRLRRYHLDIGRSTHKLKGDLRSKFLSVNHFDVSTSSATIKDLVQRADILILGKITGGCKNLTPDIVQIEGEGTNELSEIQLSNSKEMECLIDTTHLHKDGIIFLNLVKLRITWMTHLEVLCLGSPPDGLFEKLEELHLAQCSKLRSILSAGKLNLCSLKVLKLENCPMLKSLFTPAVAQSLVLLEVLKIRNCDGLKHIVTNEEEEIVLDDNQESYNRLVFPKLKQLLVKWCRHLEYLMPVSFSRGLAQLDCLDIDKAPELKYVFCQDQSCYQNQNELQIVELPVLKLLKLIHLPNIISIFPENYYPMWPSLNELYLLQCPQLSIISINNSIVGSTVRQQGHTTVEEPRPLVVHSSQMVDEVSSLLTLQNVERLTIGYCNIEGIFQLAGLPIKRDQDPLMACLQQLSLENLPELSSIFKGPIQVMGLPNLVELHVHGCRRLKSVFSTCIFGSLPQLEVLEIKYCDQLEQIIENEEHENSLNQCMESNEVDDCQKITSTSCSPLEDFTHVHKNSGSFNLCSLKQLKLESCSMLTSLFPRSTAITLVSLQSLAIEECHGLKYIIAEEAFQENKREEIVQEGHDQQSDVLFPKLTGLKVKKCDSLEYIFPVSFARGLVELKSMVICETPQIQHIFGQSDHEDHSSNGNQSKAQIELPVLTELCLQCLPNIISICPKGFYVTCSSLQRLSLDSLGFPIMPVDDLMVGSKAKEQDCSSKLESCELASDANQLSNEVQDLQTIENSGKLSVCNCQIEAIFQTEGLSINREQDPLTSSLSYLDLRNLPELRFICKGPLQFLSLENLRELSVVECRKLKFIFSSSILRSLPQLMSLTIKQCEQLEQIIEEDQDCQCFSNYHCQQVCFPRLAILDIQQCNNLKCLFSISSPQELFRLQYLFIEDGSLLEKVFGCKENEIEEEQALMLPNLEYVRLRKLPNLIDVCQGFKFKRVYHEVEECPKLTSTSTATLQILSQEYQNPEGQEVKEAKEERQEENKGEEDVAMQERNVIDLASCSVENKEFYKTHARTPSVDILNGIYHNKATETIFDFPKVWEDSCQGHVKDSMIEHHHENFNPGVAPSGEATKKFSISRPVPSPVVIWGSLPPTNVPASEVDPLNSSTQQLVMTSVEEYAAFRDIGEIKKRHIPLLEQAIVNYPCLWAWCEKFKRPQIRQLGYIILGDLLEFLASTRWRDLTEEKKAEFDSLVSEMQTFGFDIQWLEDTQAMMKQSTLEQETINRIKTLEGHVTAKEVVVEDLEVRLHMAKLELANAKSELRAAKSELRNLNEFIGF